MILKMYTVRDSKAEIFNPPFFQRSAGEALRAFSATANNKETTIYQNPEDYDLYYLGEYDDVSGKLDPLPTPQHVTKAVNERKNA